MITSFLVGIPFFFFFFLFVYLCLNLECSFAVENVIFISKSLFSVVFSFENSWF